MNRRLQRFAGSADYDDLAKQAANNHAKFKDFAWFAEPDDSEVWTLVYTSNRDSNPIDRANAEVIESELSAYVDCGDVISESHNHWAVGYVDGFAIRVYDESGETTEAFRTYCDLQAAIADYPVLDDEILSRIESEEIEESWDCWIRRDFERALDKAHETEYPGGLDLDDDTLRAVFDAACSDSCEYPQHTGSEVIVRIETIVEAVSVKLLKQHVPPRVIRINRNGYFFCFGFDHFDEYWCDSPIDYYEFDCCMEAMERGDDSIKIGHDVYSWEIA